MELDLSPLARMLDAAHRIDYAPAMRRIAIMIEGIVRGRIDQSVDVSGRSLAPLYPKPENLGRKPLKRSGALHASIRGTSTSDEARIGTPAVHARILFRGGKTRAHTIWPRNSAFLAWTNPGGSRSIASSVRHPGSDIPERNVLALNSTDVARIKSVFIGHITESLRRVADA